MRELDYDRRLSRCWHSTALFLYDSFDETLVLLSRNKRRAQLAPPSINQSRGNIVATRNTRNARAGGKGFFQNAPPLLQTPMAATFRSAENRDPAHNNRS